MKRENLTEKLLDIKREKGWSWKHVCAEIGGMSPVMIAGGVLGQQKMTKPMAAAAAKLFGLSKSEEALLNAWLQNQKKVAAGPQNRRPLLPRPTTPRDTTDNKLRCPLGMIHDGSHSLATAQGVRNRTPSPLRAIESYVRSTPHKAAVAGGNIHQEAKRARAKAASLRAQPPPCAAIAHR